MRLFGVLLVLVSLSLLHLGEPCPAAGATKPPSRNIVNTPHNLSVSGGGGEHDIRSTQETRICVFCHTPHHATSATPLWSRTVSELTIYIPYASPTLKSRPDQPLGPSRLCLSCHDGTIALGLLAGGVNLDPSLPTMPYDPDPNRNPNLGTDLSDDHPISMAYPFGLNLELTSPGTWPQGMRLSDDTYVECTSCHDPHNNQYGRFLIVDSSLQYDAQCVICHRKNGWDNGDTAHRTGGIRYPSISSEVGVAGCRNCHIPHSAPGIPHILKAAQEEDNCFLACHNQSPYSDIRSEFVLNPYTHPVGEFQGIHKANPITGVEDLPVSDSNRHVECVDCHNPHRAGAEGVPLGSSAPVTSPPSVAPFVSGALRGIRGIDKSGTVVVDEARYEYEVCFRCHAGSSASDFTALGVRPIRFYEDFDESQRFTIANPSFHPVVEDRRGTGRSLRTEFQISMLRIYCSDCHHPHGSTEQFILRDSNWTDVPSPSTSYPLCFRCHSETFLLDPLAAPNSEFATLHQSHVSTRAIPCSVCHDPHGVPASQQDINFNGTHLINFDKRYAGPAPVYVNNGVTRSCTVACHAVNPQSY